MTSPSAPSADTPSTSLPRIAVILGSTRPHRNGESVAKWVLEICRKRTDARFELVDVADFGLPLLDEPVPPSMGKYTKPHTKRWASTIQGFDGYVFVTAEYNHGIPGALKNAIDFLYKEWNNKAAAFVGYGSAGGVRSVEHLRTVMAELQVATVRAQVMLSLREDFEDYSVFKPRDHQASDLTTILDQLVTWTGALGAIRVERTPETREEQEQHADGGKRLNRPARTPIRPGMP